jgi:hypothetical protein
MLVEERVINLEQALAHYLRVQERELAIIRASVTEIRASNARTDLRLLELQEQAERDRQQAAKERQQDREEAEKHRQQAEKDRQQDREEAEKHRQQAEKDRQQDREEAEKHRQQAEKDRQQAEKDRKDFNKRLAELSDSMGTLIEDMVAPCAFQLARAIFATEEAETCAIRVKRKHPARRGEMMELDLLAVGPTKLLLIEVKRRMDTEKAAQLHLKAASIPEYFPEYANREVLCAVASVYLDPSVVVFLNHERLHGIAMGEDTMQVVNLGQF